MSWKGPYKVVKVLNKVDYVIDMQGKTKVLHVNLLKKYFRRAETTGLNVINEDVSLSVLSPYKLNNLVNVCVLEPNDDDSEDIITVNTCGDESINVNPNLSDEQTDELKSVIEEFSDVFSSIPGCTDTVVHEIRLITKGPVKKKIYPVPLHLKEEFDKEIDKLLDLDIIEPSNSSFCSPVVMVKKPDKSFKITQDFRALNAITEFDSEPMPAIEDDLHKFAGCKYISEIDITKAYHQIKLHPDSQPFTAFPTSKGLMQYKRMPLG